MAAQTKRAWKLQEFVAHGSNVSCLAMGHKSGRVMVTGGEDRKVNLWTINNPNCVMSLQGHTTPVEAVQFSQAEDMAVAGSVSGALKIWNLEEAKIMRTLTGHKAGIRSLEFHPYGDYVASGSFDSNIKLWDIKRKGCIYTYKGHQGSVNCLRFSPDGRWITSAGEDGIIKLWDLAAGKLITELRDHTGPVNILAFHPTELLLASGSSDRTVKFWDLDSFEMVSSTEVSSSPIRSIFFHPDGACLYSGTNNRLNVYSWEPTNCLDSLPVAWGEVADLAFAQNQLIGCSFSKTNVSTYVVDTQRVQPFGGVPFQESGVPQRAASSKGKPSTPSHRKSFAERPSTSSSTKPKTIPREEEQTSFSDDPEEEPGNYDDIFQPKSKLSSSPNPVAYEPFAAPPDEPEPEPVKQPVQAKRSQPSVHQAEQDKPMARPRTATITKPSTPVTTPTEDEGPPPRHLPHIDSEPVKSQPKPAPFSPPPAKPDPVPVKSTSQTKRPTSAKRDKPKKAPSVVDASDFMPKAGKTPSFDDSDLDEEDVLNSIRSGHKAMMSVMSSRSRNIQIVLAMWTSGNTKMAVESAIGMDDQAVIVDVLRILNLKTTLWSLDLCQMLVAQLHSCIQSKHESYVETAINSVKLVIKILGPVIKSNISSAPGMGQGVDITREERYNKCNNCYKGLMNIRTTVDKKANKPGKIGSQFKEVQLMMGSLD